MHNDKLAQSSTLISQATPSTATKLPSRRSLRRFRSSQSKINMNQQQQQHGRRLNANDSLRETLTELKCMEENDSLRIKALDWLERILAKWSFACSNERHHGNSTSSSKRNDEDDEDSASPCKKKARAPAVMVNNWQRPRPILITFGSYRLGVHRPCSDLDLLVLAPAHCSRDDFFGSLVQLLQQQSDSIIRQVHPIPTAYTPVIKFTLYGISVDLLFAKGNSAAMQQYQLKRPNPLLLVNSKEKCFNDHRSDEYLIHDADLADQDEAGVRSLNGARVSQMILEKVSPHLPTFRIVLAAVKEWAMAKGIYSNVMGFLGGINYAIMVAYVCIHNPAIANDPVALLECFFITFASWKWPEPVMIGELQLVRPSSCSLQLAGWNPLVSRRDGLQIMPIITPAYPSMNSAYNVDVPQLRQMRNEFVLAANWVVTTHKSKRNCFLRLLRPSDFFASHSHYLQVKITSKTQQEHVEWLRLVESRLRLLIGSLETPELHVWPFGKLFHKPRSIVTQVTTTTSVGATSSVMALEQQQQGLLADAKTDCEDEDEDDFESTFYMALRFARGTEQTDIRLLTSDFCHQVYAWEKRTSTMDMSLNHLTAAQLPAYVVPPLKLLDDASTATASSSWASSSDGYEDGDDDDGLVETEALVDESLLGLEKEKREGLVAHEQRPN
ncbi:hypothetical protein MPSEU_000182800 [Mayamaea pseudoterrestris]|nr:hypothetical protein MPSEU_000182800 [Mayamaea pseudoterrestris]